MLPYYPPTKPKAFLSQSLLPTFSTLLQNCLTSLAMVEAIRRSLACSSLRARSSFCRCSSWCRITMRTTCRNEDPGWKHSKASPSPFPKLKAKRKINAKKPGKSELASWDWELINNLYFCLVTFQPIHLPRKSKPGKEMEGRPSWGHTLRATPRFQRRSWAKSAESHCISSHR